jgi:hypothetical protein
MKDLARGAGVSLSDRIIADSNGRSHDNRGLALTLLLDRTAFARERDSSLRLQNDTVGAFWPDRRLTAATRIDTLLALCLESAMTS